VGLLFYLAERHTLAYVVWAISGAVGGISVASAAARDAIDRALAKLGRVVGSAIGAVLLTVVYLVVVTPLRFVRRVLGADDLHLRDADRPSYWLPCDDDNRKVRWVGSMFATEVPARTGSPVLMMTLGGVALLLIAEGVSRLFGFGHTVLYYADPEIGYYPQPSAELIRYGGRVATNKFGMRSPEVDRHKPAGVFRVLMLGDSTLYGGSYVDQEDVYSSQVEKHFNGLGLPAKVEVLAMGCNGWGPFHERGFIHKYPDAFDADLVLVNLPIDDVVRPLYGLMEVPFFPVQSPPFFGLEEIFNHEVWEYRARRAGKDSQWEHRQAPHGIREYGLLTDDVLKAGAEVMFFVLPRSFPGFDKDPATAAGNLRTQLDIDEDWRRKLEATLAKRSVKTYFARGFFKGKGTEQELYRDDGIHLNPKGHHVYAQFIEAKIKEDSQRYEAWSKGAPVPKRAVHDGGSPPKPAPGHEEADRDPGTQPVVERP
jgi:hypothetical protein